MRTNSTPRRRPGSHTLRAIQALLERFVEKVPTPLHRIALESCALTRLTTEPLLAVALEQEEVYEIFEWLRGLSFITVGKGGLFPHDLVRDVLSANLRWRNPDRYLEMHQRIRGYYARRLEQTSGREQRRVLLDVPFSTLRRHLKQGVARVTWLLWQREVGRDQPLSG